MKDPHVDSLSCRSCLLNCYVLAVTVCELCDIMFQWRNICEIYVIVVLLYCHVSRDVRSCEL